MYIVCLSSSTKKAKKFAYTNFGIKIKQFKEKCDLEDSHFGLLYSKTFNKLPVTPEILFFKNIQTADFLFLQKRYKWTSAALLSAICVSQKRWCVYCKKEGVLRVC